MRTQILVPISSLLFGTHVYCVDVVQCLSALCSQDSMLEFDGQPIDPAIVSAQPMKPAQNMDLPQMVCPPGRFYKQPELLSCAVVGMVEKAFLVH